MSFTSLTPSTKNANFLSLVLFLIFLPLNSCVKLKFATEHECERYSMDSLYHDKYRTMTDDIFEDSLEFVSRTCDLVVDSVTTLMAQLPGSESSSSEEKKIFSAWRALKRKFAKNVDKMKKNITSAWESLLEANLDMLLDRENSSLPDIRDKTQTLTDAYKNARANLDSSMATIILPVRGIVLNGLKGLTSVAEAELKKNAKNESTLPDVKSKPATDTGKMAEVDEEELRQKLMNVTLSVVPSFLGKVTLLLLERKIELNTEKKTKPEDRDSVLDDICFTFILAQSRTNSIIYKDMPKTKESRDLARRNLYMYWSELASTMFQEKIQAANKAPSSDRKGRYKRIWENEDDIADTLVTLMEMYS